MATISIGDNDARIQHSIGGGGNTANSTQFTIDFPFFSLDDINVIITNSSGVDTTLTRGTGSNTFAVTGTAVDDGFSGGNITLGSVYTSSTVTIFRDVPITRTSDFATSGPFNISSLNTDLDKIYAVMQQIENKNDRALTMAESDDANEISLPNKATRKGNVLAFNATTGAAEAGPSIGSVTTVSSQSANINTLAGISANITTVAGISSNVTTVAGISSNVTSVAGNSSNINAAASNATNINTVAGNNSNITTVAGISSDVTSVAGISSNVTTVAGKASLITSAFASGMSLVTSDFVADVNTLAVTDVINDINTLATSDIVADLNTLATSDIVSDINTLATSDIVSDLNTLATSDIVSDINTLATSDIVSDLNLLATSDFVSDLNTMATTTNVNNLATVASNITGVNTFVERYRVGSSEPSSNNDAGDLFFNTTTNELRAFNGSSFQATSPSASSQTNINIVAGEITSTEDLGLITESIDTSSGNNIDTVANNITNINTVGGISSNVTTVAGISSNVTSVASIASNVTTVANNISGLNSFAERYRVASSEPSSSLDAGDLYFNTSTNTLNFYNGSSFVAVVAGAMTSLAVDSTPQLGGNLDVNGNSIVSASNGDITIAPNGSGEINLNGTVNTDNLTMDFGSIA
tara:strand:+ start:2806 stop:4737 length:1932 start_codon:yes stop_codon:yes gene_type:complete